jgi:hypothetical protein
MFTYQYIFDKPVKPHTPTQPLTSERLPFQRELTSLSYKMYQHNKTYAKKQHNFTENVEDQRNLDTCFENLKQKHIERSSWKTLDRTYKWTYIQEYIHALPYDNHIKGGIEDFCKQQLSANNLKTVIYSNKTNQIERLGITYTDKHGNAIPV